MSPAKISTANEFRGGKNMEIFIGLVVIFARIWYDRVQAGAAARGLVGRSSRDDVSSDAGQGMGFA